MRWRCRTSFNAAWAERSKGRVAGPGVLIFVYLKIEPQDPEIDSGEISHLSF
jgi:hypothetical protein